MDRSWMLTDRRSKDFEDGVQEFLNFATIHAKDLESIRCPCIQCGNLRRQPVPEIRNHLFVNGIDRSYRTWIWHGEPVPSKASQSANTRDFSYQEVNSPPLNDAQEAVEMVEAAYNDCLADPSEFKKLIEDAEVSATCIMLYMRFHWVLCIIDLSSSTVYFLDSLNDSVNRPPLQLLIKTAFIIYDSNKGVRRSSPINWKTIECPKQPTNVECGFYVMKYMKELIRDEKILKRGNFKGKKTYTEAEIDEVRAEWIKSVINEL